MVVSDWRNALDCGNVVCAISLDVSGAFDSVNHSVLITRLQQAGFQDHALEWLKTYLLNRMQRIKCSDALSDETRLESGVPQGSIIGPCLFNLYMAPLAKLLESKGVCHHIYTDDVLLYEEFDPKNPDAAHDNLQQALELVDMWMRDNCLLLNAEKTCAQLFHRKKLLKPKPFNLRGAEINVQS